MTSLASQFQHENEESVLCSQPHEAYWISALLYDGGFELEPIQTKLPFGSPQTVFSKAQARQLKQLWCGRNSGI